MMMSYLANTAHLQFFFLVGGFLAWILTTTTTGLNEWRLWYLNDTSIVTSGVAWVGIWRACFYSHVLTGVEFCQYMDLTQDFVPVEVSAAQVMMMMAVICGLAANVSGATALRMAYFSVRGRSHLGQLFVLAGSLYICSAGLSLVPVVWNMKSVLGNSTIEFPPQFHLPAAPLRQQVGSAIGLGVVSSILMLFSGLVFLSYPYVQQTKVRGQSKGIDVVSRTVDEVRVGGAIS